MGKIVKKVRKIIPREVKPFVAPIAAYYLGPMALKGAGLGSLSSAKTLGGFLARAAASGITSAGTQKLVQDDVSKSSTLLSALSGGLGGGYKAGPDYADTLRGYKTTAAVDAASEGLNADALSAALNKSASVGGQLKDFALEAAAKGTEFLTPTDLKGIGKYALATGTADVAERQAELNEKALRDYEAQLREQGIMDSADRRNKIFGYFSGAGYEDDEINAMLDKYGYATGGRVGYKNGRSVSGRVSPFQLTPPDKISQFDLTEGYNRFNKKTVKNEEDEDDEITREEIASYLKEAIGEDDESKTYKRLSGLQSGLQGIMSGYEMATGQPLMGVKPQPTRFGLAEGGIMNVSDLNNERFLEQRAEQYMEEGFSPEEAMDKALDDLKNNRFPALKDGGMLNTGGKEMDMRGGGFIPIGSRERADDVPARLSKNEFVMTADAVRAAGGGNINKGAKRMYDLMNKLEAKA